MSDGNMYVVMMSVPLSFLMDTHTGYHYSYPQRYVQNAFGSTFFLDNKIVIIKKHAESTVLADVS